MRDIVSGIKYCFGTSQAAQILISVTGQIAAMEAMLNENIDGRPFLAIVQELTSKNQVMTNEIEQIDPRVRARLINFFPFKVGRLPMAIYGINKEDLGFGKKFD